jgi:hypothetical protein
MPHPDVENGTPFEFVPLFGSDEGGRPIVAPLLKATYEIGDGGSLALAEEQRPIEFAGSPWGEPGTSSYRFEPESAFVKTATDVILVGAAHATRPGDTQVDVLFQVGPVSQVARVTGNRFWCKRLIGTRPSEPEPFETIPLIWENAFGGRDPNSTDPERPDYDVRNPVGCGYRSKRAAFEEGARLPNLEHQHDPMLGYRSRPEPVGFGFTSPDWEPRRSFSGTYDEEWERQRSPLLPQDFDRRFFSAAAPGLSTQGFLRGDEDVLVVNASPEGRLHFPLPGLANPEFTVELRNGGPTTLQGDLDTVVVDLMDRRLFLLWRAHTSLREGPTDVEALRIDVANAPERPDRDDSDGRTHDNIVPLFSDS